MVISAPPRFLVVLVEAPKAIHNHTGQKPDAAREDVKNREPLSLGLSNKAFSESIIQIQLIQTSTWSENFSDVISSIDEASCPVKKGMQQKQILMWNAFYGGTVTFAPCMSAT